jgi:CDP-glycerol glycerophosphotransferase (TagB/SpsB family)
MEQWLPVFELLNERHSVLVIARQDATFRALRQRTSLPILYLRRLRELNTVMQSNDYKVALYINNSALNFHALMFPTLLHVHLNHGESDKISMASNQAKAYDQVYVAGQAAIDRYRRNLISFDGTNLVCVGRPQLDVTYKRVLKKGTRPTVLYAPTWEGERDEMNYTSLDCYGVEIVRQLLAAGKYRVVYKPHPRVADPGSTTAIPHATVVEMIEAAAKAEPEAGHRVEMTAQILGMFRDCDAMIADVSSVGLDFLYMATEKPLILTDRHNNRPALLHSAPVAAGSYVIDRSTLKRLSTIVEESLTSDAQHDERQRIRQYYFGDLPPGQSLQRFMEAIDGAIERRDAEMLERDNTEHAVTEPAVKMAPTG